MSAPVSGPIAIGALDLAALLCSRVCHDLISPVGAIVNGLEVLEEDKDEETKTFALDLIKKSAYQASAKLQFCRLAFGAAGSAGAQIDLGEAEKTARGLLEDNKTNLAWNLPRQLLAKKPRQALAQHAADRGGGDSARGNANGRPAHRWRRAAGFQVTASGLNATLEPDHRRVACRQPGPDRRRSCHSTALCRHPGTGLRAYALGRGEVGTVVLTAALTGLHCGARKVIAFRQVARLGSLQPKLNALTTNSPGPIRRAAPDGESTRPRACGGGASSGSAGEARVLTRRLLWTTCCGNS